MMSPDFLVHYPLQPRDSRQASKDAVAAMKEADGKSKAAAKALKAQGNGPCEALEFTQEKMMIWCNSKP